MVGMQQQQARSMVPDIPGHLLRIDGPPEESQKLGHLREHVSNLCGLSHSRFPGAQPVSFDRYSIPLLQSEDYWVCEKSDGQRVLILILVNQMTKVQEVFLIDRKNDYRQVNNLRFPHHAKEEMRNHTLLDGELVLDRDPRTGSLKLRLLLFDCVVLDRESMTSKPLMKRYGRLKTYIFEPYFENLKTQGASLGPQPFEVKVKEMDLGYSLEYVLAHRMPALQHDSDGLIFTCLSSGYIMGTDEKILKWKPPSENTIDFKLRLKFPPDLTADPNGRLPDLTVKPIFLLDQYMGGNDRYEYFDWLWMGDEEWEQHRDSGTDLNDKIVECYWEAGTTHLEPGQTEAEIVPPRWRFHRIRDDKTDGNHSSVVEKILRSIQDGVEKEDLLAAAPSIRAAWKSKEREAIRNGSFVPATLGRNPHRINWGGGRGPPIREGPQGVLR